MLNVKILTLFPELYPGHLGVSVIAQAIEKKLCKIEVVNIRDFAEDKHKNVDDTPYGGGSGMVMRVDILAKAIDKIVGDNQKEYQIYYPSPRGKILNQKKLVEIAGKTNIILLCARFEGIDQRLLDEYNIAEISIGDYVLSGGDIASQVILDGAIRLIPGVLGSEDSLSEESFAHGTKFENLLEYPHYTRPAIWRDKEVPKVLLSGDHGAIKAWRLSQAREITGSRRPDLLSKNKKDSD
jgi:tRNA (guanine37-N1)-methyltransferase